MVVEVKDLTNGERLLIYRLRSHLTQPDMAKKLSVSTEVYRSWETDAETRSPRVKINRKLLLPHEESRICRRRSGLKQWEVAQEMGVSRIWVLRMEAGKVPADRLLAFWRARCE